MKQYYVHQYGGMVENKMGKFSNNKHIQQWVKVEDVEKLQEENNHLKKLNRELVLRNELFAEALFPRNTLVIPES